jgi:UDP-N-acetylglucosamine 2-epimerase (non-hydrolysing)
VNSRLFGTAGDLHEVSDHRGPWHEAEAIKLALLIHALRQRSQEFEMAVVQTGQHRTMLDHALQFFKIKPDFDLDVMRPNQTLNSLAGWLLDTVENACHRFDPTWC